MAHTVVLQPKKVARKKSLGSYIAIGFGVFAIVVFAGLMAIGFMLQTGMMPDGDLYDAKKLPPKVTVELLEKNVLNSGDVVNYYQSESTFSFTNSGTLFTDESIRYFETDEKDEVLVWDYPLRQISKLVLDSEMIGLGIEIITMEIYDEEGKASFIIGLTPRSWQGEAFKADLMQRWHDAKK